MGKTNENPDADAAAAAAAADSVPAAADSAGDNTSDPLSVNNANIKDSNVDNISVNSNESKKPIFNLGDSDDDDNEFSSGLVGKHV
jgi:hypothetical protein